VVVDNGHEGEAGGQGQSQGRDVRCQLSMTVQELTAVKRHLAESRRENDDLLKAVAYLRSKLDLMAATGDDTPTNLHTHDSSDITTTTPAAAAVDEDDDGRCGDDDDELWNEDSSADTTDYNSKYSDIIKGIIVFYIEFRALKASCAILFAV